MLGVLVVITLILLPYFIRQGVEQWLVEQGAEQVRIEDIDFNLFIRVFAGRSCPAYCGNTWIITYNLKFPLLGFSIIYSGGNHGAF